MKIIRRRQFFSAQKTKLQLKELKKGVREGWMSSTEVQTSDALCVFPNRKVL